MKIITFFLSFAFGSFFFSSFSQAIIWEKTFGGIENDVANALVETPDGGIIVCGNTESKGAGKSDVYVLKIDNLGNMVWEKTFGGPEDDKANAIIMTSDGNYAIAGSTESFGKGKSDFWIIGFDRNGNRLFMREFGGPDDDIANAMIQTLDGQFVSAGSTKSKGAGSSDFWIVKSDTSSKPIWQKSMGGKKPDEAHDIIQNRDSTYLVVGNSKSVGSGSHDMWIVKLDPLGRAKMKKEFGGINYDYAKSVVTAEKGSFIIAGSTMSDSKGFFDFLFIKIGPEFEKVWELKFGGKSDEQAECIISDKDGNFMAVGYTFSKGAGKYDGWVGRISTKGELKSEETFGGTKDDKLFKIIKLKDGDFIACGYTTSSGEGKKDMWVMKFR